MIVRPTPPVRGAVRPTPSVRAIAVVIEATALPGRTCGPYTDVEVGLQVRKQVEGVVPADVPGAAWRAEVRREADGRWHGPAVHGVRGERFLYLVWRGRSGPGAPVEMFRRAKLRLDGVPEPVAAAAEDAGTLFGRLGLTDACGMPLCASVWPETIRWAVSGSVAP